VLRFNIKPSAAFTTDARVQLARKIHGILAPCKYPLHASLLEGIMNEIKLIKRIAYGFRGDDYFLLRIGAAFPRNVRYTSK